MGGRQEKSMGFVLDDFNNLLHQDHPCYLITHI